MGININIVFHMLSYHYMPLNLTYWAFNIYSTVEVKACCRPRTPIYLQVISIRPSIFFN